MDPNEVTYLTHMHEANQIFTPSSPISRKAAFSGRKTQIVRVLEAITAPGRHPIIYGQRGVGKTSLANILSDSLNNVLTTKVVCDGSDSFHSIWNRMLQTASVDFKQKAFGFSKDEVITKTSLAALLGHSHGTPTPSAIAQILKPISSYALFIFDEFDKIKDRVARLQMADLIKILSDESRMITVLLVGVGGCITELIDDHPSISRSLVQIELPKMTVDEIKHILSLGFAQLKITVNDAVLDQAASLSHGFPHFAHLLGLNAAKACHLNNTTNLTPEVFQIACTLAIEDAIEIYRTAFASATSTTQPSRYPHILCACAYAHTNDRDVFRATDVVEALHRVFRIDLTVPSVVPALGEFTTERRASILTKVKLGRISQYCFSDPMLRPYLRIKTQTLLAGT